MNNKGAYARVGLPGLSELFNQANHHKECTKCEGRFQTGEQIRLDIYNNSYCESCYKEVLGEGDKE